MRSDTVLSELEQMGGGGGGGKTGSGCGFELVVGVCWADVLCPR